MQAFAALQAERRWIATGTPIVNSPGKLSQIMSNEKLTRR
jgi:SNF2 family DNA or RNA helicase